MVKVKDIFKSNYYLVSVISFVAALFMGAATSPAAFAAGNTQLYIAPASQSLQTGSNLTLNIMLDTGGNSVNAVQTTVSYPAGLFNYVSLTADPTFAVFQPITSTGNINFAAGSYTPLNGVYTVATLVLHAVNPGNAVINLSSICTGTSDFTCSVVLDSATNQNDLVTIAGGSYTVNGPDTTPPTAPANLTATTAKGPVVNLSWHGSTDPLVANQNTSGLNGYRVFRCLGRGCTKFTQLVQLGSSSTTYTDSSANRNTTYTYYVVAFDNVGNVSAHSNQLTVKTPSH